MSEDRDRISRIAAEQMLSGAWTGWGVGSDPLGELLAAHAAAAREDQLADRLVRAAPGAHRSPIRATRKHSIVKLAIARLVTAKAVVALIALGGGVALAAGTGHMPGMSSPGDHRGARLPADVTPTEQASESPTGGGLTSTGGPTSAEPSRSAQPSGTPSANVRDLCVAVDAARRTTPAKVLDDPAFTVLIIAAGGKENVAAYCAVVLAAEPGSSPSHPGDQSSHQSPSAHATGPNNTHPTGPNNTHPSGPNKTHPSGPNNTHPTGPNNTHPSRPPSRPVAATTG